MAENKKGFLLYADYLEDFSGLNMEERGQLITTILEYVNDLNPEPEDRVVRAAWIPIKKQLKRDLEKYEDKRKKFSAAGKASADARKAKKYQMYIILCEKGNERFLKVGVSENSISRRYAGNGGGSNMPYKYSVLAQYVYSKGQPTPAEIENNILNEFKKNSYKPSIHFGGHSECLRLESYPDIIKYILNVSEGCLTTFNDVEKRLTFSTVSVNDSVSVNDIPKGNNPKPLLGDSQRYLNLFNSIRSKHLKNARGARTFSGKLQKKLKSRLQVFTWEEIEQAINNAFNRDNHKESNYQYLTPEFFVRGDEHLEKFLLTQGDSNPQAIKLKRLNKRAV